MLRHGLTVQQLIEKAMSTIFFVFIDLRKAYDSVPCEALWVALSKLGVPPDRADPILSSGHEGNHQTGQHFAGGDQEIGWGRGAAWHQPSSTYTPAW